MKSLLKIIALCVLNLSVFAQSVTILPSGITPAGSIPKLSYDAIRALPSPNVGDMATDTTFNCLRFFDGKQWAKVLTNADAKPAGLKILTEGGASVESVVDMAVDTDGNVYLAGTFIEATNLGNISLTSEGSVDIFIAKYNKNGVIQWAKKDGGAGTDVVESLAIDNIGNIYMSGYFSGTTKFGNTTFTNNGDKDIFIAKYTNNGTFEWVKKASGSGTEEHSNLAVDTNGNVYLAGNYSNSALVGTKTIISKGFTDIFIAKYTSVGNFEWVKTGGSVKDDEINDLAIDNNNNLYITGGFYETATFGNISIISTGQSDIFVAKYSTSNDAWAWALAMGGTDYDFGRCLAIDNTGNILAAGGFRLTVNFFGTSLNSKGGIDAFLIKFDPNGNKLWVRGKGGEETDYITHMDIDNNGNIYAAGWFRGISDFGSSRLESIGNADTFFAKFNYNGFLIWVQSAGGPDEDYPAVITAKPNGNVYMAGTIYNWISFGDSFINSNGPWDIYFARIGD